ncbi:uncharacterized protein LOC106375531 isoform X2 [Brassica napus]|uniref:uncharacterized protein LOC106375531 isoform X2 n=1 Tax=Brassica napus TaxID=3708 RepID=UPI002079196C|nr:uncharacterized protein LOC106375531 isoform X2 [Brassica napus]
MKKLETDGSDCSSRLERNEDHMTEESSTLTTGKKAKRLFIKVCVHSMEHWESVCADFLCHENKGIAGTLVLLSSCVTLFMLLLSSCVTSFDYQSIFGSCCCTLVMYVFLCQVIYVCQVCTFL